MLYFQRVLIYRDLQKNKEKNSLSLFSNFYIFKGLITEINL